MEDVRKDRMAQGLALLVGLVFVAYCAALLQITLVKGTTIPRIVEKLLAGRAPHRAVNLIPFVTIRDYLHYAPNMPVLRWFANIFGNLLIFVPLGLYLPLLFSPMKRFSRSLGVFLAASLSLEVLQYVLGTGSSDIDDVWLNTTGGCLGYLLFVATTKLAPRRVPALCSALALSLCFAGAGYAVAYREFGLYLGLATLTEDVRGGSQLPSRAAEVTGQVARVEGASLFVTGRSGPFENAPWPGTDATAQPAESRDIEVTVGPATRFFDRRMSLEGHTMVTRYEPYTPTAPADIPGAALASVWGRWNGARLEADVVWTMRIGTPAGTVSVAAPQATAAVAPGLPKTRSDLLGHLTRVTGDDVVLAKIRVTEQGTSMFAVTTSIEETFRLTPTTVFYQKRILNGGRNVTLTPGSRSDLVRRANVEVWGTQKDGVLTAGVVCVNVFK